MQGLDAVHVPTRPNHKLTSSLDRNAKGRFPRRCRDYDLLRRPMNGSNRFALPKRCFDVRIAQT